VSSTIEGLERGVAGTSKTIDKMHRLVQLGKLDPTMQKIATWIRLSVPDDKRGKTKATADAIFKFVKEHGIFQSDPFQIEKIEHPIESMRPVIEARAKGAYRGRALFVGDCDTIAAVWPATLLGVLGFQYAFETAKVDASRPDEFSHVWVAARMPDNSWYPLDPSTEGAYPGWRPPVTDDRFKRWPEGPIEDVVRGADMSSFGMGDDGVESPEDGITNESPMADVDAAYPEDFIGYPIPKDFGAGPGVIPPGNFDDLQLLPPHETQIPAADLEPDMHFLKAAPTLEPAERVREIAGQPNDHGNPYYRGPGPQPYYKIERQPYPPGSIWNDPIGQDTVRYVDADEYVKVKSAESPEMKVEVKMGQPMLIRRRRSVMTPPARVPYGALNGMGDEDMPDPVQPGDDWQSTLVTSIDTSSSTPPPTIKTNLAITPTKTAAATPSGAAAASAGGSVWDAIGSVFKAAGTVVPSVLQSNLAKTVANATNKLAGRQVVQVGPTVAWYKDPILLGLGLAALGGAGYVIYKMRPGVGRRRR
jgi:hypothetical protein